MTIDELVKQNNWPFKVRNTSNGAILIVIGKSNKWINFKREDDSSGTVFSWERNTNENHYELIK